MTKQNTNKYGEERIAKVEVQQWRDENDVLEYGLVWITSAAGDVYAVSTNKGETEEGNAARYRARGWTDSRCTFFSAK